MSAKTRLLLTTVLFCLLAVVPQVSSSELFEKQARFSQMLGQLLTHAGSLGYQITVGDAYARDNHSRWSLHYCRLAIDLNLFKDGVYLKDTESHKVLGVFWESMGGSWGGRWQDGNHYEMVYRGKC